MINKIHFNNIEKFITGLLGIIIALSCVKDEICLPDASIVQPTEIRSGESLPDFFSTSLTIYDYDSQRQIIINRDSLDSISYARVNTEIVGKTDLITQHKYTAGIFRVLFHFKSGVSDLSGVYYVKNFTGNIATQIDFNGATSLGKVRHKVYVRQSEFQLYYDHRYQKNKRKYLYIVDGEREFLECWHHPNSSIFLLNHVL